MTTNKKLRSYSQFLSVLLASGLLVLSCLNPIGFNPDLKLSMVISGEIGIDSVNSAEIQIRNHTKSIDIYKTNIVFVDGGDESTAARITGAPIAGTQESILLRPIGPGAHTKYRVEIWYRQSASCPDELKQTAHPSWDFGGRNPDQTFEITELPRGKYVIHLYRKTSGGIEVGIEEDPSDMTEMGDNKLDLDFVANVKVNTVIDLSGAEINLTMPSGGLNVNTSVSFSNEVTAQFNALIDAINASKPYPSGYGMVIVRNHTSEQVSNIEFSKDSHTVGLPGVIRAEDQNGMILSKGTWEARLSVSGTPIGPKNAIIQNQGKEYLHVYKNKNGGYSFIVIDKEWTSDLIVTLPDVHPDYSFTININVNNPSGGGALDPAKGVLYVHNMTTKALDNPEPGKMVFESIDLDPPQTFSKAIGAKSTIGGQVDPANWTASVGTGMGKVETSFFVSHMQPTHIYYYKTKSGGSGITDYWPPADADLGSLWDGIELGDDQGAILIKNRSDYILDYFTWNSVEYEIQLTSGDDHKQVVPAGTSPIGFKIRNGSYGEYVTRTINPGQILTITVQGNQIIDITPPAPPEPPAPPPPPPPAYTEYKTMRFVHETTYRTPIEYLILYRDTGTIAWKQDTANGYPGVGSGIYYMYQRGKNATVAPNNKDIHLGLPMQPSNYGPYLGNFKGAPIHGLDDSFDNPMTPTHLYDPIINTNKSDLETTGKISVGTLGNLGNLAVKVKGTVTGTLPWDRPDSYPASTNGNGRKLEHGKDHQFLEIEDSIIIQFDPPLQWHQSYDFKVATKWQDGSNDEPVNWFVAWIGSNHEAKAGIRYSAGYDDLAWFIMRPDKRTGSLVTMYARGVGMKYQ